MKGGIVNRIPIEIRVLPSFGQQKTLHGEGSIFCRYNRMNGIYPLFSSIFLLGSYSLEVRCIVSSSRDESMPTVHTSQQ